MCAYASIIATSSAVVGRTVPFAPARRRAVARCTCPNAPKSTFAIERFIARPIIIVSSVPDAPTSMPPTISTLFSSSKPVAAAARPVNAFSSEITTGMSAPPIGSTNSTPKSADAAIKTQSSHWSCTPATSAMPAASATANSAAFTTCWPGYVIGRPPISSCSFANATIEPANEIEPISADSTIASEMSTVGVPGAGRIRWNSASAIKRRRAAADAVEQRHHLRHRGHLHLARRDRTEAAADRHADHDRPPARRPDLDPA